MPVMNVDGYDYTWKKVGEATKAKSAPWQTQRCSVFGEEVFLWEKKYPITGISNIPKSRGSCIPTVH